MDLIAQYESVHFSPNVKNIFKAFRLNCSRGDERDEEEETVQPRLALAISTAPEVILSTYLLYSYLWLECIGCHAADV
jgi:hypothetical protein